MGQTILSVVILSVASIVVLFILTKLMGYRQMSQLSSFDYINGITIGSIAAEMATNLEEFYKPLTAMIVYAGVTIFLALITNKSLRARKVIEGKPLVLLNNGILDEENMKRAKIDINELLMESRLQGYFDLSKLQSVVLEENGQMSFLPKAVERPLTPTDMSVNPPRDYLVTNLVLDGKLIDKNLNEIGKSRIWLMKQLSNNGVNRIEDVLLASCDCHEQVTVFQKHKHVSDADIFM